MNECELTVLVNNEIEWRRRLWKKVDEISVAQVKIDNRVVGIETKNALFGSFFGAVGGALMAYFTKK